MSLEKTYPKEVKQILSKYPPEQKRSAVMPLLYLAQREEGYVNKAAMQDIAKMLDITETEVASIVGFYTLYHDEKAGKYRMQVCTDLPCALRGADEFLNNLCGNLGIKVGETTADGLVTLEGVMCLAACDKAPMFQTQGPDGIKYHENMTVDRTMELIEALKGGEVMAHVLLRHRDVPDINKLDVYKKNGGIDAFKKAVTKMQPNEVTDVVKASGLRGRGGAGFPTGMKWSFIDNKNWPHYVVANADESEPGTFKDRELMESNPFQFLEGLAIASYAVGATAAYVYLRGEFWQVAAFLDEKIAEMEKAGYLGDNLFGTEYSLKIFTHLGAGAYICGEETALLESLEGKRGQPRVRPPFPPSFGLYGKPTIINNVETFANVPPIIANGADWYKSMGTADSAGVKLFSLSGRVRKPGNYELPFGKTFRELIYEYGGGIQEGRPVKAIMPAGASSSLIVVDDKVLDTPMDYATVRTLGADLGSASVIVIDDTVSVDWIINKTIHFFKHESCGKCTPCREGNYWMQHLTERIHSGDGAKADVDLLLNVAKQMQGKCLCALGEFATMAVVTGIERFPQDFKKVVKA